MIKGLAYSPSAPCEWGMNIWQRTCTASLAFQPPRLLCDRAANYGSIIIGVPDDGTIQFSRSLRSDVFALRQVPLGKLSSHLVADENGQFVALKLKVFQKFSNSLDFLTNILVRYAKDFRNFK